MLIDDYFILNGKHFARIEVSKDDCYRMNGKDFYSKIKKGDFLKIAGVNVEVLDIDLFTDSPMTISRGVGLILDREVEREATIELQI